MPRSIPTPLHSQPLIRMSLLLSVLASPRTLSTHGLQESSPGIMTRTSLTRTSTFLPVCLITYISRSLLILIPPSPSELEICRRLTLEEEKDEIVSTIVNFSDNFTATKYILYGLDLEEQQCVPPGSACVHRADPMTGANCRPHSHQQPQTRFPLRSLSSELPSVAV